MASYAKAKIESTDVAFSWHIKRPQFGAEVQLHLMKDGTVIEVINGAFHKHESMSSFVKQLNALLEDYIVYLKEGKYPNE